MALPNKVTISTQFFIEYPDSSRKVVRHPQGFLREDEAVKVVQTQVKEGRVVRVIRRVEEVETIVYPVQVERTKV